MISTDRGRGRGAPAVSRVVNAVQAGQDLTTLSILSKRVLSMRARRTSGVGHHAQTLDVSKKGTATPDVARRGLKGEPVRILFHEIPITGRQAAAPTRRATGCVSRYGGRAHAKGQNIVTQASVEVLVKSRTCGVRANVTVDTEQVEGFSTNRVVEFTDKSVTRNQNVRGAARPMAVIQGAYGNTGPVSTDTRVGQDIKASNGGGGIISRVSLGKHEQVDFLQPHHHLGSGEFGGVGGARFASRGPGADSEATLLQRH